MVGDLERQNKFTQPLLISYTDCMNTEVRVQFSTNNSNRILKKMHDNCEQ